MKKKFISTILAMGMLASCVSAAGCGGGSGSSGEVEGKTNISVGVFNRGVGREWIDEAAKRFESLYEGKSFETDKMGVAVQVNDCETGETLANSRLRDDVYFTEAMDYYYLQSKGKLAPITDIVSGESASLSAYGEETTIAGKLDKAMNDFLTAKGEYYAIPYYDGFYGIIYDADMFARQGWFLDNSGNFTKNHKSVGLDGVEGTYDDGLPQTYEQFQALVEKIAGSGDVTPFLYSSASAPYFIELMSNYWANYEGKEKMLLNWYHDGEADIISSFEGDEPVITQTTITANNTSELQKQPGKYYALQFLKDIIMAEEGEYLTRATDHKEAQYQFISSILGGDDGDVQEGAVAMIFDGAWFENEANMAGKYELAMKDEPRDFTSVEEYKKERNFGFMPIPKVSESQSNKQTIVSANDSFCFINAGTEGAELEVAKEFMKFLHSEAELAAFTAKTSITRPYTYSLGEAADDASYFAKTLMQMKQTSDIVYPYSNGAEYVANSSKYSIRKWAWSAKVSGNKPTNPFEYFRNHKSKTAKEYFEGLVEMY